MVPWGRQTAVSREKRTPTRLGTTTPMLPMSQWHAVSTRAITDPYFFEERGHTVTVTATRYKAMLERFLVPKLQHLGIPLSRVWFQQDGATLPGQCWTISTRSLERTSCQKIPPGRGRRDPWTSQPLNFFPWGWLKTVAYRRPPNSLTTLKRRLRKLTRDIPAATLATLTDALVARPSACLREWGGPIEHLLLR